MKKRIYLASPFFNDEEREALTYVEKHCFSNPNLAVFSPRLNFNCPPQAPMSVRKSTFDGNVSAILQTNVVLASIDSPDIGTAWEMGFARALRIPVIAYSLKGKLINLMLAQGVDGFLFGVENLTKFLEGIETGYGWDLNYEVAQEWKKDII
jgi:nucleoside 2-deoxyribosyltransferase